MTVRDWCPHHRSGRLRRNGAALLAASQGARSARAGPSRADDLIAGLDGHAALKRAEFGKRQRLLASPAALSPQINLFRCGAVCALAFIGHDPRLRHFVDGHMLVAEVRFAPACFQTIGKCGLAADNAGIGHRNSSRAIS